MGGGSQCIGLAGAITTSKELTATIIVVPNREECRDEQVYPYKSIVFHGDTATSVRCVTEEDVEWYKRWIAGKVHLDILAETPKDVAPAISCPPPDPNLAPVPEAVRAADEAKKLGILTDWMKNQYKRNGGSTNRATTDDGQPDEAEGAQPADPDDVQQAG
jgi:hypothetical protein